MQHASTTFRWISRHTHSQCSATNMISFFAPLQFTMLFTDCQVHDNVRPLLMTIKKKTTQVTTNLNEKRITTNTRTQLRQPKLNKAMRVGNTHRYKHSHTNKYIQNITTAKRATPTRTSRYRFPFIAMPRKDISFPFIALLLVGSVGSHRAPKNVPRSKM